MVYVPRYSPSLNSLEDVRMWVEDELQNVSLSVNQTSLVNLKPVFADVDKPRDGMIVHADGTHFNPGGGAGAYEWVNGAWHKLGPSAGASVFPDGSASVGYDGHVFGAATPDLQVNDTTGNTALGISMWNANFNYPRMILAKSEGATVGTHVIVASFQTLGSVGFLGSDGTTFVEGAGILARSEGTPAANSMPGHLAFFTNPGSTTSIEQVRVDSKGNVALHQQGAVATNATDGFIYIPTCPGAPTGVPTSYGGQVPFVYDTTNDRLNVYDSGWKAFFSGTTGIVCVPSTGNVAADTTAIQNALNAGGLVVLTSAAYTITPITVPGGSTLMGMGPFGTVLSASGTTSGSSLIVLGGSGAQVVQLGITSSIACGNAIRIHGTTVTEACVSRVNIEGAFHITNGVEVAGISGGFYNVIEDCRINNCISAAVLLDGPNSLACRLYNLDIGGNGTTAIGVSAPLSSLNGAGFSMDGVSVEECGIGFDITNASYFAANCTADSCGTWGWRTIYNTTTFMPAAGWSAQLNGCQGGGTSSNPGGSPQPGRGMGFFTTGSGVLSTVNLTGCLFENNATDGLGVTAGAGTNAMINVIGCNAFRNGVAAAGGSGHGMYFNSLLVNVVGNVSSNNTLVGSTGIFIDTACTGNVGQNSGTGNASGVCVTNGSVNVTYKDYTGLVANLPAPSAGSRGYVTNATVTTFSTIVVGGGGNVVPVYADGTNWRIG